ncbi:HNH endonuclease [Nakamurella sp.]|uniref:HNH endonuclease signature motif containing protein n=1 Tax=Nakamurella sp. TaxID=1869182 RepID=UPI003B3ACB96
MPFASKAIRDRARRRVARRVMAGEPCVFCKQPIDLNLVFPDPKSFVVDHGIPTSLGGTDNYEGLRPAHNTCNRQRSNLPTGTVGVNSGSLTTWGEGDRRQAPSDPSRHRNTSGAPNAPGVPGG